MKIEKVRQMFGVTDAEFQHFIHSYSLGLYKLDAKDVRRRWRRHHPNEEEIEKYKQQRMGRALRSRASTRRRLAYEWQLTLTHRPTGLEIDVPAYNKFNSKRERRLFANNSQELYMRMFKKMIDKLMVAELEKLKNNGVALPKYSNKQLKRAETHKRRLAKLRGDLDARIELVHFMSLGVVNEG